MTDEKLQYLMAEAAASEKRAYCISAIKRLIREVEELGDGYAAMDLLAALVKLECKK